jgi:hypothetical protein
VHLPVEVGWERRRCIAPPRKLLGHAGIENCSATINLLAFTDLLTTLYYEYSSHAYRFMAIRLSRD